MKVFLNNQAIEIRYELELLPDDELRLHPAPDVVTLCDGPGGTPPKIGDDGTITLTEFGRYRFVIERDGEREDLHLLCCDPALFVPMS